MTLSETLALINAGYTKAEIAALETGAQSEPAPAPQPEPAPVPQPEPAPAPEPQPAGTDLTAVLSKIEELTKAVINQNIIMSSQSNGQAAETVNDILATIINPK